jgi:predicted  nucleic acid-binding Zn-ribbon protein
MITTETDAPLKPTYEELEKQVWHQHVEIDSLNSLITEAEATIDELKAEIQVSYAEQDTWVDRAQEAELALMDLEGELAGVEGELNASLAAISELEEELGR